LADPSTLQQSLQSTATTNAGAREFLKACDALW
jgi:hypothetical protein